MKTRNKKTVMLCGKRASCFQSKIKQPGSTIKGSEGTEGGVGRFIIGFGLAAFAVYLFFDSGHVVTDGGGRLSEMIHSRRGGGMGQTASMGILFVPFFPDVFAPFVNSRQKWAWSQTCIGIAVLAIEIARRFRFHINAKLTHLLEMIILFAAGCAPMFRSFDEAAASKSDDPSARHFKKAESTDD